MAIGFSLPGVPFKASTSAPDLTESISKGFALGVQPKSQAESLLNAMLQNKIKEAEAKYADKLQEANLNKIFADTGLTSENTLKQKILNQFLPEREPAEINEVKARAKYYESGGSSGGVGAKDYMSYVNGVAQDNPNLTQDELKEATDVLANGGTQLSNGKPLNPMSLGTRMALDRSVKASTTSQQINQSLGANQSEAELDVIDKLADEWTQPYAETFFNKSPKAFYDSFKNDDESQKRLGKFIAGQAIQFESAGLRSRQANAPASITAIEELMKHSGQVIDARFPRVSSKARKYAAKYLQNALSKGLEARNKIGIGASYLIKKQNEANKNQINLPQNKLNKHNMNDYDVPPGYIGLYKNGEPYFFPPDKVEAALEQGFSYE